MFTIENTTNITENERIRAENGRKVAESCEKWRKISEIGRKVTKKHEKNVIGHHRDFNCMFMVSFTVLFTNVRG